MCCLWAVPVVHAGLGLPVPQTYLHASRDINCKPSLELCTRLQTRLELDHLEETEYETWSYLIISKISFVTNPFIMKNFQMFFFQSSHSHKKTRVVLPVDIKTLLTQSSTTEVRGYLCLCPHTVWHGWANMPHMAAEVVGQPITNSRYPKLSNQLENNLDRRGREVRYLKSVYFM